MTHHLNTLPPEQREDREESGPTKFWVKRKVLANILAEEISEFQCLVWLVWLGTPEPLPPLSSWTNSEDLIFPTPLPPNLHNLTLTGKSAPLGGGRALWQ
jgi:hypothetical protein